MGDTRPKRLVQVAFPLEEVSAHSRREKNIRHALSEPDLWIVQDPVGEGHRAHGESSGIPHHCGPTDASRPSRLFAVWRISVRDRSSWKRGQAAGVTAAETRDVIAAMANRIVDAVQPLQVILFGSYARGTPQRWSDVDFLVVIPNSEDKQRVWDEIRAALRGSDSPYDLVVATADEVRRRGNLVGMVLRPALREGKVLYDATAPTPWDQAGRPVQVEVESVTEDDRLAQTQLWLRQARNELGSAEVVFAASGLDPDAACYLAQQAAEKAFKAVLVFLQVQYPFTHDLDAIREDIPADWDVRGEFRNLKKLSDWLFKARYPGGWAPPTRADARQATRLARAIYEAVLRDLRAHGLPHEEDR